VPGLPVAIPPSVADAIDSEFEEAVLVLIWDAIKKVRYGPQDAGLGWKKLGGADHLWEARVNSKLRVVFEREQVTNKKTGVEYTRYRVLGVFNHKEVKQLVRES
jgi:hypothetical protein